MERLEGGLEKLKSTAAQVDDLKEKLAAQEVELKQKNDDADALIKRVGVEQEKVSISIFESCTACDCALYSLSDKSEGQSRAELWTFKLCT